MFIVSTISIFLREDLFSGETFFVNESKNTGIIDNVWDYSLTKIVMTKFQKLFLQCKNIKFIKDLTKMTQIN